MFDKKIYETKNYSIFKKVEGNRDINESHVKKIMASIVKKGYILNPISVDENMGVLEGQHSLEALKRLGMSVPYIIIHNAPKDACRILNDTVKPWGGKERIVNSAAQGDAKAQFLLTQKDMHTDLKEGIVYEAFTKKYDNSRRGLTIVLNDSLATGEQIISIIRELKNIGTNPGTGTTRAIKDMIALGADPSLLLSSIQHHGKEIIGQQSIASNSAAYIILTQVYNKCRKTNYIEFPSYGSKKIRKMLAEAQ